MIGTTSLVLHTIPLLHDALQVFDSWAGSLKGQDVGKVIAMIFIMLGALLATLAVITGNETIISLRDMISSWFSA